MRILVVNVNTSDSITQAIARQAQAIAAPGTEIVGLTPYFGAESVEGNFESYLAAIAVMDRVLAYDQPYDAVIQAGYGEHGREGLQELLNVPVVDITDAAASTAMFLGHAYSVVTTLDRTVPLIEDRLRLSGLYERCASVRASGLAVLELEEDPARAVQAIVHQAELAVAQDKAEVICLGCGGMAGLDEQIRQRTGVPVVDGVTAAVTIAESLVRQGLSTSKVRTYATPRPKRVIGWPMRQGR
ncbi:MULTISPECIES: aspartate/glutamate racemase family protein [unclassified Pseudomonas]|uniref:aspartate/glutamate racemase family protein n=1 Tax=unclassified Pseudomonas TaxID=196821 RepID=UPI0008395F53|nr:MULTISPECIES: aspartate/glutamate racemase family protein [unclassified Pseudomonas]QIH07193.1 Asp/Glu/hydantoin racemase [Pseudomonas sp. BIOMIG1BAC]